LPVVVRRWLMATYNHKALRSVRGQPYSLHLVRPD